jgi:aminopeptidase N
VGITEHITTKYMQVRIWSWPDMEPYLDLALETSVKTLDYFAEYFDYPSQLDKIGRSISISKITFTINKYACVDLVALPELRPGAMENWGLVLFKHEAMAYNQHISSTSVKATSVIRTIIHELSHQVK